MLATRQHGSRYYIQNIEILTHLFQKMLVVVPRVNGKRQYYFGGSGYIRCNQQKNVGKWFQKSCKYRSAIVQKFADAVVNGAKSAKQKAVDGAVNEAINTVTPYVNESVQMLISRKRPHVGTTITTTTTTTTTTLPRGYDVKKPKINISSLINGSRIALD